MAALISLLLFLSLLGTHSEAQSIYCGKNVTAYVESDETQHYQLIINDTYQIINIDACSSTDDIGFIVTVSNANHSCPFDNNCFECPDDGLFAMNMSLLSIDPGIYPIYIYSVWTFMGASYQMNINCIPADTNTSESITITSTIYPFNATFTYTTPSPTVEFSWTEKYVISTSYQDETDFVGQAESECETTWGTTMATVVSIEDQQQASSLIFDLFPEGGNVWIGLYADINIVDNVINWEWMDGTAFNWDTNWYTNKSHNYNSQMAVFLDVNENQTEYRIYENELNATKMHALCNIPTFGNVRANGCYDELGCWTKSKCCSDMLQEHTKHGLFARNVSWKNKWNDSVELFLDHLPPFAYWNGRIFVFTSSYVHYTAFHPFEFTNNAWNYTKIVSEYKVHVGMIQQLYAQYRSSLYMLLEEYEYDSDFLLHIDLDTLQTETIITPPSMELRSAVCVTTDGNHVYIMTSGHIVIYNILIKDWVTSQKFTYLNGTSSVSGCGMTADSQLVYFFVKDFWDRNSGILRYNTAERNFAYISAPNPCYLFYGSGITAPNGKIYVHGCALSPGKTLVFDPVKEQFQLEKIVINDGHSTSSHRYSRLTLFDDNVLLLMDIDSFRYASIYYAMTNIISINFADTNTLTWPSDGFDIKYYVNDFTNYTNDTNDTSTHSNRIYNVLFVSKDTVLNDITAMVVLNIETDDCICNETVYKCYGCHQHFNLKDYLAVFDNDVAELRFEAIHKKDNMTLESLILPKYITIHLERCIISFINLHKTLETTNDDPSIELTFSLSSNCYSRIDANFSLNITSTSINIHSQLVIHILNITTKQCRLCSIEGTDKNNINCYQVSGNSFVIYHETKDINDGLYYIIMESNMIDFTLNSSNIQKIRYIKSESSHTVDKKLLNLLYLLIIPIIIVLIIFIYWKRQYNNAYVIDRALVAIIGISKYDITENYVLENLSGVGTNVKALTTLWKDQYNYDVFVCNSNTLYATKKEVIRFFDNYRNKLEHETYKCGIVHIISHGDNDSFFASDGKEIGLNFIRHELTSAATFSEQKELLKIIFHHACRGNAVYHIGNNIGNSNRTQTIDTNANTKSNEEENELMTTYQTRSGFTKTGLIDNKNHQNMAAEANCITIAGNLSGRAMSDSGLFTNCICNSFESNLNRRIKADFNTLLTEIGRNLEQKTNDAEICNISGALRYDSIRFEKCSQNTESKQDSNEYQIEMQSTTKNANNNDAPSAEKPIYSQQVQPSNKQNIGENGNVNEVIINDAEIESLVKDE